MDYVVNINSIMNTIAKTHVSSSEIKKDVLLITIMITINQFLIWFCECFIVDLLMQHKFCSVNLINGTLHKLQFMTSTKGVEVITWTPHMVVMNEPHPNWVPLDYIRVLDLNFRVLSIF